MDIEPEGFTLSYDGSPTPPAFLSYDDTTMVLTITPGAAVGAQSVIVEQIFDFDDFL